MEEQKIEEEVKEEVKEEENNTEQETEEKDPSEELNEQISRHVVAILNSEDVAKLLPTIKTLPKEELQALIKIIALAMANSSFGSVVIYDAMLKGTLEKHFNAIGDFVNNLRADLNGVIEAMKIHQKKIGILENKGLLSEIEKEK